MSLSYYKDRCFILVMSQEMVYSYITHSNRFLSEDDFLEELFMYMTMPTKTATFLGFYVLLTLIPHKNGCSFFRKWKFSKCFFAEDWVKCDTKLLFYNMCFLP